MKRTLVCLGTALLVAPALRAQSPPARPQWGLQAALLLDGGSTLGVGGSVRYRFGLTQPAPISAHADLDWFPDRGNSVFDLNWNLAYDFVPQSSFKFYAGGGVNARICTSCGTGLKFGLNGVGGFDMGRLGRLQPYLEGRYTFFSLDALIVTFGVRF